MCCDMDWRLPIAACVVGSCLVKEPHAASRKASVLPTGLCMLLLPLQGSLGGHANGNDAAHSDSSRVTGGVLGMAQVKRRP
jgi:hypothetical protein